MNVLKVSVIGGCAVPEVEVQCRAKGDLNEFRANIVRAQPEHHWLFNLLMSVRQVGRMKANTLLKGAGVGPPSPVGQRTRRQRMDVASALRREGRT
jgi:hypothetical protein